MASNALRVVPVIDGISESSGGPKGSCTSLCVSEDSILLGRSNGHVDVYQIQAQPQPTMIPTVGFVRSVDLGTKKGITCIASSLGDVVCVSGDNAYWFRCDSATSPPSMICKGVSCVAIQERSVAPREPVRVAVATLKRKIIIFEFSARESGFQIQGDDISTGSDLLTTIAWFNNWIIGGSARAYVSVCPVGERTVKEVFLADGCVCISVLKATNEVLLVGQDGLGIFMSVQSEGLTPAPRNTVAIGQSDAKLCVIGSYLVSLSGSEGLVEVFSLTCNETKLIQTINLPSAGMGSANSFSASLGIPLVAGSVMYLLITVPFESQLRKLVQNGKVEEALELVNLQFSSAGEERISALKSFHSQVGWKFFQDRDYTLAFIHLSLGFHEDDVRSVLARLDNDSRSEAALCGFLSNVRPSLSDSALIQDVEALLLEILPEPDLVMFVESVACELSLSIEKVGELLHIRSPVALARFFEIRKDFTSAGKVLFEALPATATPLIDLIGAHFDSFDQTFILAVAKALISKNLDSTLILGRLDDPVSLLDQVGGFEGARAALESLADSNVVARDRLIQLLIQEKDAASLEALVVKFRIDSIPGLIPDGNSFDFLQMLLLGNQGRHREALAGFTALGEKYLDTLFSKISKAQEMDLLLLFAAVLFEQNQHLKGVDLLLKHKDEFLSHAKPSEIVDIIPSHMQLTAPLIEFLKKLNRRVRNKSRSAVIKENLSSYSFLTTYSEWSSFRQTNPVQITHETLCGICNQLLSEKLGSVAVLPSGSVAHAACLAVDSQN